MGGGVGRRTIVSQADSKIIIRGRGDIWRYGTLKSKVEVKCSNGDMLGKSKRNKRYDVLDSCVAHALAAAAAAAAAVTRAHLPALQATVLNVNGGIDGHRIRRFPY